MIPDIVTLNSETDPSGPFYVYARPESNEIVTITHLEFARATHRAANLLRPNGEAPDGRVVAILALSDTVLYHATLVGLMTANLVVRAFRLVWTRCFIERTILAVSHVS
jgi:acyl-CoA synthetase (AMP-forming)/AMP-acid ligase II